MPAPVTGESITDEQIRELRARTGWVGAQCQSDHEIFAIALGHPVPKPHYLTGITRMTVAEARARCASIWNARAKAGDS